MPPTRPKDSPLGPGSPLDAATAEEARAIFEQLVTAYQEKFGELPPAAGVAEVEARAAARITELETAVAQLAVPPRLGVLESAARALGVGASEIVACQRRSGGRLQVEIVTGQSYTLTPDRLGLA